MTRKQFNDLFMIEGIKMYCKDLQKYLQSVICGTMYDTAFPGYEEERKEFYEKYPKAHFYPSDVDALVRHLTQVTEFLSLVDVNAEKAYREQGYNKLSLTEFSHAGDWKIKDFLHSFPFDDMTFIAETWYSYKSFSSDLTYRLFTFFGFSTLAEANKDVPNKIITEPY